LPENTGFALCQKIMVSRHQHPVAVRLLFEPVEKNGNFGQCTAHGKIAGMYQHIAGRQRDLLVFPVGIGDKDKFHGGKIMGLTRIAGK
jgi:hypothetical protein